MEPDAGVLQQVSHRAVLAGQEACAQPVGVLGEAQVEAGGLHLSRLKRQRAADRSARHQRFYFEVGQDARRIRHHLHPMGHQA